VSRNIKETKEKKRKKNQKKLKQKNYLKKNLNTENMKLKNTNPKKKTFGIGLFVGSSTSSSSRVDGASTRASPTSIF
jgi:hypothetical protein